MTQTMKRMMRAMAVCGCSASALFAQAATQPARRVVGVAQARVHTVENITYMGTRSQPVDPALRAQLDLPEGIGLLVKYIEPDGPAAQADLRVHDILEKFDDQILMSTEQLGILIRMRKAGEEVNITALRQGETIRLRVKLGERKMGRADVIKWDRPIPPAAIEGRQFIEDVPRGQVEAILKKIREENGVRLIYSDREHQLRVKFEKGEKHLEASDRKGAVVFEGSIQTDEQRKAVPAAIASKLDSIKTQIDELREDDTFVLRIDKK